MKQELENNWGEAFIQVEYWEKEQILYSNWTSTYLTEEEMQAKMFNEQDSTVIEKSVMGFREVKRGCLLILNKIKEYEVKLLLNDNRQVQGVWDEINDWIVSEWMPQIIQAGLCKFAHILSEEFYAQLSAEMMEDGSTTTGGAFEMKLFNDQKMTEDWLLKG